MPREASQRHIPHRVRAAIARLPMKNTMLRIEASIDPVRRTDRDEIYWRCATDAIWEGRLAATRWLIESVGIKRDEVGRPARYAKKRGSKDIRIDDFDGGVLPFPVQTRSSWPMCGKDVPKRQATRQTSTTILR
jgi:hypothetical protein